MSNSLFILSVMFGDAFCETNGVVLIGEKLVRCGVLGLGGCVVLGRGRLLGLLA